MLPNWTSQENSSPKFQKTYFFGTFSIVFWDITEVKIWFILTLFYWILMYFDHTEMLALPCQLWKINGWKSWNPHLKISNFALYLLINKYKIIPYLIIKIERTFQNQNNKVKNFEGKKTCINPDRVRTGLEKS